VWGRLQQAPLPPRNSERMYAHDLGKLHLRESKPSPQGSDLLWFQLSRDPAKATTPSTTPATPRGVSRNK